MSTRSATLPVERSYLLKAWFAVATIVLIAAAVIVLALSTAGTQPVGGTSPKDAPAVADLGPAKKTYEPIVVNGNLCGQCR